MKLRITAGAERDLDAIFAYIGADNPVAADEQLEAILAAVEHLPDAPRMGRPGKVPDTRELVIVGTSYIAVYRLTADTVFILRILHGRRRWPV